MYRQSHVYLPKGWKTPMNCHGDETWNEVAMVKKKKTVSKMLHHLGEVGSSCQRLEVRGQITDLPIRAGCSFSFFLLLFFFSFLFLPSPKARDLNFENFDSSSGCVVNKSWESGIWGPWRGVRKRAAGPPLWLCIDLPCDLGQVILSVHGFPPIQSEELD